MQTAKLMDGKNLTHGILQTILSSYYDSYIRRIVLSAFFPFLYMEEFFHDIKEERHL